MTQWALGLIEVKGLPAALEAADTCLKSSNTQLIGYEKTTGGLVTVKIQGDVGAVKAAIDAAKISAAKIGPVVSSLVIPRPAAGINGVIYSVETVLSEGKILQKKENMTSVSGLTDKEETSPLSPVEDIPSAEHTAEESEVIQQEQQNEESLEEGYTCNLCHDPNCPRTKGQPRKQCIHHNDNQK
nr:BMC domain-containing protein [uncultured Bacillus sp.]